MGICKPLSLATTPPEKNKHATHARRRLPMKTLTRILVVLCCSGLSLAAHALDQIAPAYGLKSTVLSCFKSEDGLRVNLLDGPFLNALRKQSHLPPRPGEPLRCLEILAETTPPPGRELPKFAQLNRMAYDPQIQSSDLLIWTVFNENAISAIVGCQPVVVNGNDASTVELRTVFVDTGDREPLYTRSENAYCRDTLDALESMGHKAKGPISAALGRDDSGKAQGGLLWVIDGRPGGIEIIECNMELGVLRTTYRESHEVGLMPTGTACIDALDERDPTFRLSGPVPIPQSDEGVDPLDLIWDLSDGSSSGGGGAPTVVCCACAPVCDCGFCDP
jgi:hypothetical protein